MSRKTYHIEITNTVYINARHRGDRSYWASHDLPTVGEFATQRAAREWMERNGFTPVFAGARPTIYQSAQGGMQATIRERGRFAWIESSNEARELRRRTRA